MGAWGTGTFENDTALDWTYSLDQANDTNCIWQATEAVFLAPYIDSQVATEAIAAIEVATALKGQPNSHLPEDVEIWLNQNANLSLPDNYYLRATDALQLILGDHSELKELWEESDSYKEWLTSINNLLSRLSK